MFVFTPKTGPLAGMALVADAPIVIVHRQAGRCISFSASRQSEAVRKKVGTNPILARLATNPGLEEAIEAWNAARRAAFETHQQDRLTAQWRNNQSPEVVAAFATAASTGTPVTLGRRFDRDTGAGSEWIYTYAHPDGTVSEERIEE